MTGEGDELRYHLNEMALLSFRLLIAASSGQDPGRRH